MILKQNLILHSCDENQLPLDTCSCLHLIAYNPICSFIDALTTGAKNRIYLIPAIFHNNLKI